MEIVGFGNDVALVVQASNIYEMQIVTNEFLRTTKLKLEWVTLKPTGYKTKTVVISIKWVKQVLKVQVESTTSSTETIKCLECIKLNRSRSNVKRHIKDLCQETINVYLKWVMSNIRRSCLRSSDIMPNNGHTPSGWWKICKVGKEGGW